MDGGEFFIPLRVTIRHIIQTVFICIGMVSWSFACVGHWPSKSESTVVVTNRRSSTPTCRASWKTKEISENLMYTIIKSTKILMYTIMIFTEIHIYAIMTFTENLMYIIIKSTEILIYSIMIFTEILCIKLWNLYVYNNENHWNSYV